MSSLLEMAKASRRAVKTNTISRIENGEYDTIVDKIELFNRKDGQGSYIIVSLTIVDSDIESYNGDIIPDIFSFHPYKVKHSMYKLEEMLDSCNIDLDDEDYSDVNAIHSALKRKLSNAKLHIRFSFNAGEVRIDYLHGSSDGGSYAFDEDVDLSDIPF